MCRAVWFASLALVAQLLIAASARATFVVPAIQGHVTDGAGVLSAQERADIEQRLTRYMGASGAEIAVFVPASLAGETVEDVAYKTFNAWGIGREKLDNGVLLVIAPAEHRVRIETGKGIGGQLTDLQASDIIEHKIAPRLREGRYHDAIVDGVDAIALALGAKSTREPSMPSPPVFAPMLVVLLLIGFLLLRVFFGGPFVFWRGRGGRAGRGGGAGGGFSGGGGGGYSGGGGRSGGGGASGGW
jgi:uncharacterized protein